MDKLRLENHLCFKLYALSRLVTNVYRPVLDELDITYPQYLVMLVLWQQKEVTVKDLGNRLYLDSGTLTPLLKRLEQKGFLRRQRDPLDERSVIISLSPAGRDLKEKGSKVREVLEKCITLKRGDYEQLRGQLDDLLIQLVN